jgi:hypothetical protein
MRAYLIVKLKFRDVGFAKGYLTDVLTILPIET